MPFLESVHSASTFLQNKAKKNKTMILIATNWPRRTWYKDQLRRPLISSQQARPAVSKSCIPPLALMAWLWKAQVLRWGSFYLPKREKQLPERSLTCKTFFAWCEHKRTHSKNTCILVLYNQSLTRSWLYTL